MDIRFKRPRAASAPLVCALALALSACGGSSGSGAPSGNSARQALGESACGGAARALFQAMQGSYEARVTADSSGSTLALNRGTHYAVTVSGDDCSVRIAADQGAQIGFAYSDVSTLTGLSPDSILKEPQSLDLAGVQYNVGVHSGSLAYELERRVRALSPDGSAADGDLFLSIYGLNGSDSFYALEMLASSKR